MRDIVATAPGAPPTTSAARSRARPRARAAKVRLDAEEAAERTLREAARRGRHAARGGPRPRRGVRRAPHRPDRRADRRADRPGRGARGPPRSRPPGCAAALDELVGALAQAARAAAAEARRIERQAPGLAPAPRPAGDPRGCLAVAPAGPLELRRARARRSRRRVRGCEHARHDLLRPRRPVARHRRRRRPARPPRARLRARPRRGHRLRHRRSATRRCARGSPSSTASTPEQVIVTNGSMQADAFLFETLVERRRRGRRREADLRPHAADPARRAAPTCAWSTLEPDGIDVDELRDAARRAACGRRSRTSSRTSRTRPATRCRATKRDALLALAGEYGFMIFEDDPYVEHPLQRRGRCRRCSSLDDAATASSTRRRSPRRSAPASASATSSARRSSSRRSPELATNTYISPNMVAQSIVYEFCAVGGARPLDRDGQGARCRARRRARRRAGARAARGALTSRPRAATSCGSSCPRAPTSPRCSTPPPSAACVRQGHGLPARGRREHAAPRLLRRHAPTRSTRASRRLAEAYRSLPVAR